MVNGMANHLLALSYENHLFWAQGTPQTLALEVLELKDWFKFAWELKSQRKQ